MFADLVLLIHVAVVLFNVGGLVAIGLGGYFQWRWVQNRLFRAIHLLALGFVSIEVLLGITCPLTHLEDWLRDTPQSRGFVSRWLHSLLYWDLPVWVFAIAYVSVFLLAVCAWWWVPPRSRKTGRE